MGLLLERPEKLGRGTKNYLRFPNKAKHIQLLADTFPQQSYMSIAAHVLRISLKNIQDTNMYYISLERYFNSASARFIALKSTHK